SRCGSRPPRPSAAPRPARPRSSGSRSPPGAPAWPPSRSWKPSGPATAAGSRRCSRPPATPGSAGGGGRGAEPSRSPAAWRAAADLLEVPRDLERAAEAALGDRLQWIVVDTVTTAKQALAMLREGGADGGGHATFLPLDWLNGGPKAYVPDDDGVVGGAGGL